MIVTVFGSMTYIPFAQESYAPMPAAIFQGEYITIIVHVQYYNFTSHSYVPLVDVDVRIFATDELVDEDVLLDAWGEAESTQTYEAGQILILELVYEDVSYRLDFFVPYDASGDVHVWVTFVGDEVTVEVR